MKLSLATLAFLVEIAIAAPSPNTQENDNSASSDGAGTVAALQSAFDRNNPEGTPTNPGNKDDLNGDGVINLFEAGAQAS